MGVCPTKPYLQQKGGMKCSAAEEGPYTQTENLHLFFEQVDDRKREDLLGRDVYFRNG